MMKMEKEKMKTTFLGKFFAEKKSRISPEMEYLNNSVSIYDLERRQKEIDRGMFRQAFW